VGWASLHLDARALGVVVPAPFSSHAHLALQYGRNMPIPITDLEITEDGVSATLSFSRVPHRTYVPWSAVYAISCTNGCGVLYREDLPRDVSLATPTEAGPVEIPLRRRHGHGAGYAMAEPAEASPWLRIVPPEEHAMDAGNLAIHLHSRRRRPQLRVVK
jgi:stringent starvation protein B